MMKIGIPTWAVAVLTLVSWIDGGPASKAVSTLALVVCIVADIRAARRAAAR